MVTDIILCHIILILIYFKGNLMSKNILLYVYSIPFLIVKSLYKIINIKKKKILIYTDSRGIEITKKSNRRNPFSSYIGYFVKNYKVDYVIMPESHTTIIDFLYGWNMKYQYENYDIVIIHLGIVDFSSRPENMIKNIRQLKDTKVLKLFENNFNQLDAIQLSDVIYDGEYTSSLYSKYFLENYILKELKQIDNLIYIGLNKVLDNWDGNYNKKRPQNINTILDFNSILIDSLENIIDISSWSEEEIKKYTVDNIHLSSNGFKHIKEEIKNILKGLR